MTSSKYLSEFSHKKKFYDIRKVAEENGVDLNTLPYTIRILLENVVRKSKEDVLEKNIAKILHWQANIGNDVAFYPARILLQDYTGVPCVVDIASMRDAAKSMGIDVDKINPEIPVDLVIDHSVQVDEAGNPGALAYNIKKEFERNSERYELLKWAQESFDNFRAIPPDTGIIHQINIEYLSPVIQKSKEDEEIFYPDSVFGTDSHTTMINGLGVLGWGVGGIEAEACMLGEASIFAIPEVIGVRLINSMPAGTVATDVALKVTQVLRENNVVGKFVEYFGEGYTNLTLADRATISNMSPEYGSTCGYFPIDQETLAYLELTGRSEEEIELIRDYAEANAIFYDAEKQITVKYSKVIDVDLSQITSNLAGPKRPQDMVKLTDLPVAFEKAITAPLGNNGFGLDKKDVDLQHSFNLNGQEEILHTGDVLIAAITSCTNTSNPEVLVGAGLLAKKAVEAGLKVDPKVKTSFAPGSQAVTRYLDAAGLLTYMNQLGFNIIAYGCTTCIGNSGPLQPEIEQALTESDIVAGAVLSGNRNFESRVHPLIKANYLASPILVVAYALAGNLKMDLQNDPVGVNEEGTAIYLSDIWPSSNEINEYVKKYVTSETYTEAYKSIFSGTKEWNDLEVTKSLNFEWSNESTYIANPPYFDAQVKNENNKAELKNMTVLAKLGDSVTTDHISPAGNIPVDSPAGKYLIEHGIAPKDFNSYGARRGNHHVMTRGTLANTRLHNELAQGKEGGYTTYKPTQEIMTIFDASEKYKGHGTELLVIAGKDYGMGSSRDWAAKGVKLLGVKAIIAESYERIHRSNLVMMGLLPLQFLPNENADSLSLTGKESFSIKLPEKLAPNQKVQVIALDEAGSEQIFEVIARFDSNAEINYYETGGILNQVLAEKK